MSYPPYKKQGFENGQVLEDKHLIVIEEGIIELQEQIDEIASISDTDIKQICK